MVILKFALEIDSQIEAEIGNERERASVIDGKRSTQETFFMK
jgi:hypothetical protein